MYTEPLLTPYTCPACGILTERNKDGVILCTCEDEDEYDPCPECNGWTHRAYGGNVDFCRTCGGDGYNPNPKTKQQKAAEAAWDEGYNSDPEDECPYEPGHPHYTDWLDGQDSLLMDTITFTQHPEMLHEPTLEDFLGE